MGYGIFGQKITGIRDIKTPLMGPQKFIAANCVIDSSTRAARQNNLLQKL